MLCYSWMLVIELNRNPEKRQESIVNWIQPRDLHLGELDVSNKQDNREMTMTNQEFIDSYKSDEKLISDYYRTKD